MTNMENIVQEIKKRKDIVDGEKEVISIPNMATQRMRMGNIKRAKEDLVQLYYDYRKAIQGSCAFIITTGTQREKFAKLSKEKFACFSVDAESLYKDLCDQIPHQLYKGKTSSPGLFDFFSAKFGDRAIDIDIIGHQMLRFESKYKKVLKDKADLLELMKTAFNEKVGSEVIGFDAIDKITKEAVNSDFAGKIVPIVLHTNDSSLVLDLSKNLTKITRNVFIVSTGQKLDNGIKNRSISSMKTVNEKSVKESLLKIKEQL